MSKFPRRLQSDDDLVDLALVAIRGEAAIAVIREWLALEEPDPLHGSEEEQIVLLALMMGERRVALGRGRHLSRPELASLLGLHPNALGSRLKSLRAKLCQYASRKGRTDLVPILLSFLGSPRALQALVKAQEVLDRLKETGDPDGQDHHERAKARLENARHHFFNGFFEVAQAEAEQAQLEAQQA